MSATLQLKDGTCFHGVPFGAAVDVAGEVGEWHHS